MIERRLLPYITSSIPARVAEAVLHRSRPLFHQSGQKFGFQLARERFCMLAVSTE